MKIKKVEISAFRAYDNVEHSTFDFSLGADTANFISIYAPNGYGKTSFYDAVEWGVTGQISRFQKNASENQKIGKENRKSNKDNYLLQHKGQDKLGFVDIFTNDKNKPFPKRKITSSKVYDFKKEPINRYFREVVLSQDLIDTFIKEERAEERYKKFISNIPHLNDFNIGLQNLVKLLEITEHERSTLKSQKEELEKRQLQFDFEGDSKVLEEINNSINFLINKEEELQQYFEDSYTSLIPLLKKKDCRILYSAKDIPIFYNLSNDELSHFKLFVWLKLLDKTFNNKAFEEFSPTLSLIQAGTKLGSLYNDLNITEIWDITTINSTLKQIHYYHKAGIITTESGLILCEQLKKLIQKIAEKINSTTTNFMFYYNELHLMNNTILVTAPNLKSLYVPFTLLSYYKTNDRHTCDQAEAFMMRQLQMSKLLNSTGEKERNIFFNKLYEKIDALKNLIKATQLLDFE